MSNQKKGLESIARQVCLHEGLKYNGYVASGAFKSTFSAYKDEIQYAVKIITQPGSARTLREIQAMQKCSHSNIVNLEHIGTITDSGNEYTYLIEEFLAGGTLAQQRNLAELAPTVGKSISKAINHLHLLGLVHRDIKPDNIMLKESGDVLLGDLGIVRDLNNTSLTQTWAMMGPGTPLYASPEQLNNEKHLIDWRSDQFSLGIVLSFSLFGYHPYSDEGMDDIMIITAVAERKGASSRFNEDSLGSKYPFIADMVKPWPVQRFSCSRRLIELWGEE